jgi:hypothetical protein
MALVRGIVVRKSACAGVGVARHQPVNRQLLPLTDTVKPRSSRPSSPSRASTTTLAIRSRSLLILLHCVNGCRRPLLGPARRGRETEEFLRSADADIPAVVDAMRQYWMRPRYTRADCWQSPTWDLILVTVDGGYEGANARADVTISTHNPTCCRSVTQTL